MTMEKVINPCVCSVGDGELARAFVKIEFNDGTLSIRGVGGPKKYVNWLGSVGQYTDEIRFGKPTGEWTDEMLKKLCDIWDDWHRNDLRPYCKHQKELGWRELAMKEVTLPVEKKTLGWLRPEEHPDGILCKPCPVCGYRYGTAWKTEKVPRAVIDWLFALPPLRGYKQKENKNGRFRKIRYNHESQHQCFARQGGGSGENDRSVSD
jgi:hypothetical protein